MSTVSPVVDTFLQHPGIAVGLTEIGEACVVARLGSRPGRKRPRQPLSVSLCRINSAFIALPAGLAQDLVGVESAVDAVGNHGLAGLEV